MHDPHGLTPAEAAWLRHPQHPVNNGFRMDPVPNLIVTNDFRSDLTRSNRVSPWLRANIIMVHYTPRQRFLMKAGIVALIFSIIALPPILFWPMTCDGSTEITEESFSCYSSY